MIINIAVCDDDRTFIRTICHMLDEYTIKQDKVSLHCQSFTDPSDLLSDIRKGICFQLIFLDIELGKADGIDIAGQIRKMTREDTDIIFVSNYPKYMQDSFAVHPYYFMQKPVTSDLLFRQIDDIAKDLERHQRIYTLIDVNGTAYSVNIKDILYIESAGKKSQYLSFHLDRSTLTTKGTLKKWKEILKDFCFTECYRGILVNIEHIYYIKDHLIRLENGESVPVSRKYEKSIKDQMINYIFTFRS